MTDAIEAIYPLSPTQQGMLFHTIYAPDSGVYVGQVSCRLRGEFSGPALEAAWQRLLERHSALRTSFVWRRVEEPRQVVHRDVRLAVQRLDWTKVPADEHQARLEAFARADRQRGFDVARAPLMRVTLIKLADRTYQFVWTQHHLLLDGWCQHLLLRECFALYDALHRGGDVVLPPTRPYRDYIAWLRRQKLEDAEAYWRRALRGVTAPTTLSVDRHAGQPAATRAGVRDVVRSVPESTTAALRELARQNRLTLNTVVQGAWVLLLSRYSGEEDVVFGVVVSGRPVDLPGAESMVGLFVNTLPQRVGVPPDALVLPWLTVLQLQQAEMSQYEHSPLVQVQSWSDVPRGRPLFESIFLFQNYPPLDSIEERIGDIEVSEVRAVDHTSYPLAVFAALRGRTLSLRISHDPSRFATDTVERMLEHLETLLIEIAAHPRAKVARLSMLPPGERERVLARWNDTGGSFPADRCVHQLFEAQVARTPDRVAAALGARTLTYAALDAWADRLARHLRSLGVGPEVPVGLCVDRSLELVAGVLGILKAGGAYVPLDPGYPAERLRFMLEDVQAPVLVTQHRLRGRLPDSGARAVCLDAEEGTWDRESAELPAGDVTPDNLAYVIYTSGSTGRPKGVAMGHRSLVNLLDWQLRSSTPGGGARTLQFASPSFDVCFQEIFSTLCSGGTLVLVPDDVRRDPAALIRQLAVERVERLFIPFTGLQQLSEAAGAETGGPVALADILTAGEQLHVTPAIARWLTALGGCRLHNQYGPTESHVVTALTLTGAPAEWAVRAPIGRPIANAQIYVLDHAGDPVPVGVPGELHIGGVALARGYHRRPDLTAEKFIPNPFAPVAGARLYRTGDLARWQVDGTLEFLGRIDHQVKIRGFRIELGEVEAVLAAHPMVTEAVVVAAEGASGARRLVGYVGVDGAARPTTSELRQHLLTELPEHMVPAVFVLLDALPLSPNGKVDRRALPAPEASRPELGETFVAPRTPVEARLAAIWGKVLGLDRVGVHDNFFELGGDSILSIQIVAKANQAGLTLSPRHIFLHQTIAELAPVAGQPPAIRAEQGVVTGPVPLTPIQRWFFEQDYPEPHQCNMAVLLEVREALDPKRLELALEHVLVHHDALRLRYHREGGDWEQANTDVQDLAGSARVDVVDLAELSHEEQAGALQARAAEVQGSLHIGAGPVLRVVLFRMGTTQRLLVVAHHLVVDGVSWRIIFEDVMTAYAQLGDGEAVRLAPKTTSFRHWAERLHAYAQSAALAAEAPYWLTVVRGPAAPLPRDHEGGVNDAGSSDTVQVALTAEETRALVQDVPAAYRTQINDVLLTALAQAFARFTGDERLLLDLEGHGREELFEDVDLSRTVGWFTALFPVRLDLEGAADPGAALRAIKEQLRGIPKRGIGYGLLRYAREDAELRRALTAGTQAEVTFNYLGRFDQLVPEGAGLALAEESSGPALGASNERAYLVDINGGIAGGRLITVWRYSRRVHERATIERVAGDFISALRTLIAHCQSPEAGGYTPSDFPLAHLDQSALDRLVGDGRGIEDVYPLSPMQAGLLFHSLYAGESAVYFEQVSCTLDGNLDVAAFRKAWQRVTDRHVILRTSFAWEGLEEPLQIVHHQVSIPIAELDWRDLEVGDQARCTTAYLAQDLARGFDLTTPPLMRVALIRLAEASWALVWSRHHLLLDGWSGPLLLAQWLAAYEAYASGQEVPLDRPRPYRDFIAWLAAQDSGRAEAFWRRMLEGITAPTPLGVTREDGSGAAGSEEYARHDAKLSAAATSALEQFARRHQLTVNTLVQGAWALLLGRYSGEAEVVFGVTVSGRPAELTGIESMLGVFINTLPLRVRVDADGTVLSWLGELQERLTELRQYEWTPLVQIQGWSDVPRGLPLFESMVVFENYPIERSLQDYRGTLTFRDGRFHVRTNYPVTVAAVPGPELELYLLYDRRRVPDDASTRMLRHFQALLEGLMEAPARPLSDVPMLGAEEEGRLLVEAGTPALEPHAARLHQGFEAQAEHAPEAVAVIAPGEVWTYAALDARANQVARRLIALGARPGDLVALCLERRPRAVAALLGVLKAGATCALLDPEDATARWLALLGSARPVAVLTEERLRDRMSGIADAVACLQADADAPAASATAVPPLRSRPDGIAYVDGSGGRGILVEHRAALHRLEVLQRELRLDATDAVLSTASPATESFVLDCFLALGVGARVVLAPAPVASDGTGLVRLIGDVGATVHLVRHEMPPSTPPGSGRIRGLWGAPEIGWIVAADRDADADGAAGRPRRIRRSDGMAVYVLDRDLRPVPEGLRGEICLGGEGLARGYLGDAQETRDRFVEGAWAAAPAARVFRTGERGRVLSAGTIEIAGAGGTHAWIGGFRVELDRVAVALVEDSSVEDCGVLARETAAEGIRIVAYVVGRGEPASEELRARLGAILPAALVPRVLFVPVASIPLTAAGRVDEAALCRLDVVDADLIARWEEQLSTVPGVDRAVVVAEADAPSCPPLHLEDVLPRALRPSARPVAGTPDEPASAGSAVAGASKSSGVPAESCGEPPRQDAAAPRTLPEALRRAARAEPRRGLVYIRADGAERVQSYDELLQAAERMLHGLRGIGLEPGDKVILQLNHNQDFVPAFWACVLGGLVPVPVSIPPTYQGNSGALNKLAQAWAMLGRPVVLAGGDLAPEIRAWARRAGLEGLRLAPIGELAAAAPDHDWHPSRPEDVALILLTSGSTGRPKGVMLTHANILSRSAATSQMNGFTSEDVSLNWFPLDHVGGIVMFHIRDVYLGCRQIEAPTELVLREPLRWLDWIDRYGVTVTWAPNFAYALINEQAAELGRRRWNLSSLRFILNGGEAVVAKTARAFLALLAPHGLPATAMHPAWGMSETSSAVTYSHRFTVAGTADDQRFVEVGAPIPGVSVRIVDHGDRVVEMGAIGRLQVTGPTVTCGYYDDEALTRETFTSDGWLKTGDIGYLDERRLTITGREKDVIIVNGVNFYCHEIEAATEEVPGVAASFSAACAVRRPGDDTDRLAIFWSRSEELGDGDGALPLAVTELIRERVLQQVGVKAEYVVPVDRGDIPKTGIGKIQRSALRDRFGAGDFDDILKRIDIEAGTANTLPDWFYTRVWCRRDATIALRPSAGRPAMVLLDGVGLGERLCDELEAAGAPVIRVEMGGEFARLDSRRYRIAPGDREHYRLLLASIAGASPLIDQVVHLSTYDERAGQIEGADALDAAQERGAVSLLFLVQALAETRSADEMSRVDLLVVSSHAQPVSPADPIAPEKSPMLGLLRTIPHELPWLTCRHLDLPVTAPERNARVIRRELGTAGGDREIAYRDGRRLVPRLRKVGFPRGRAATACVQVGGMYVITGGLGGIGIVLARYLLEHCDARVLLIGRTALPPRDTWIAHLAQGDAIAPRLEAYLGLERAGGQIAYEALDVAEVAEVRSAVERWESRWSCRLAGIMHLAGVLQERLLVEETREGLAASLRPKMLGSVALGALLAARPQCRIVHFASVNGLFGGATMGAYAAANCFLLSVSHAQNLRAAGSSACLSWTVWDGVGMSQEYVAKEQGRAKGYRSISVEQGLHSLLVGLSHAEPSLVVGLDGATRNIRRMVAADGARLWRLAGYVTPAPVAPLHAGREIVVRDGFGTPSECDVVGVPALPLTEGGLVDREQLAQLRRGPRRAPVDHVPPRTELERRIARIWQDVLRLPQVGIHDNFFELGGDSILAIQAISRANQAGLRFTPAQLFQHQTVAGLAAVSGEGAEARPDQGPVTGPVPLTPIQHWFFDQDLPEPQQFNMALLLTVSPELDPALMEAAVGRIVVHHDALRLRFARGASGWRQWTADPEEAGARPVFARHTLADLPEPAKVAAIEAVAAELEASLDLEQGPLLRVAHLDLGPGRAGRLLTIVHHLAVDGVSWRILLEDLFLAYQQLSRGMAVVLPPKTTSFKTWARCLGEHAASSGLDDELAHWLAVADGPGAPLPRDHAAGANTVGLARSVSVSLTREETEALLQRVPAAYHTQINDALLTALGAALARWTGQRATMIDLEGHGREEIGDGVDLSRTVGWFTALFPVRLDQPPTWSPGPALQGVKEQLRRVPNRGIGFGLLRHLAPGRDGRERLRALPSPEISFNYLGQLDAAIPAGAPFGLALAPESVGPTASARAPRPHLLDVVALVTGGRLRVDWAFGPAVHEAATIERLARDFLDRLREIIAHCQSPEVGGYTPSDFPLAKLDEEQLNTLLAQVEFEGDGSE